MSGAAGKVLPFVVTYGVCLCGARTRGEAALGRSEPEALLYASDWEGHFICLRTGWNAAECPASDPERWEEHRRVGAARDEWWRRMARGINPALIPPHQERRKPIRQLTELRRGVREWRAPAPTEPVTDARRLLVLGLPPVEPFADDDGGPHLD